MIEEFLTLTLQKGSGFKARQKNIEIPVARLFDALKTLPEMQQEEKDGFRIFPNNFGLILDSGEERGKLKATVNNDDDYPGIYMDGERNKKGYSMNVCELPNEGCDDFRTFIYCGNTRNESDDWCASIVYGDRSKEDDSHRIIYIDENLLRTASPNNTIPKKYCSTVNEYNSRIDLETFSFLGCLMILRKCGFVDENGKYQKIVSKKPINGQNVGIISTPEYGEFVFHPYLDNGKISEFGFQIMAHDMLINRTPEDVEAELKEKFTLVL